MLGIEWVCGLFKFPLFIPKCTYGFFRAFHRLMNYFFLMGLDISLSVCALSIPKPSIFLHILIITRKNYCRHWWISFHGPSLEYINFSYYYLQHIENRRKLKESNKSPVIFILELFNNICLWYICLYYFIGTVNNYPQVVTCINITCRSSSLYTYLCQWIFFKRTIFVFCISHMHLPFLLHFSW